MNQHDFLPINFVIGPTKNLSSQAKGLEKGYLDRPYMAWVSTWQWKRIVSKWKVFPWTSGSTLLLCKGNSRAYSFRRLTLETISSQVMVIMGCIEKNGKSPSAHSDYVVYRRWSISFLGCAPRLASIQNRIMHVWSIQKLAVASRCKSQCFALPDESGAD